MTQFIIRLGGLVPAFYNDGTFTCHPSEATRFNSIDELRKSVGTLNTNRGVSIVNADTLKFVEWFKW